MRRALAVVLVLVTSAAAAEPAPGPASELDPAPGPDSGPDTEPGPELDPEPDVEVEPPAPTSFTLRLKSAVPRGSPWGELLTNLGARLEKTSGRRLDVKTYWQQKSEAVLVRQCHKGRTDGIAVSFGALAEVVPELEALELPFLFDDYAAADKALARATPLIVELLAAQGFTYALRGENGFRHFATVGGFVTAPELLGGRVVRSQPSKLHLAMWQALGAEPKALQVADVPASLVGGVVTAYDNTLAFARLAGWADHVSHVTLSAHVYQGAAVVWCKRWFEALPEDLAKVVTQRDAKLERSGLELVRVFNDKLMPEQYRALGKSMYTLTAEEKAAFKARLAGVTEAFRAGTTPAGHALLDALVGGP